MRRRVVAFCSSFLAHSTVQAAPAIADAVKLDFTDCGGMVCIPVTLAGGRASRRSRGALAYTIFRERVL